MKQNINNLPHEIIQSEPLSREEGSTNSQVPRPNNNGRSVTTNNEIQKQITDEIYTHESTKTVRTNWTEKVAIVEPEVFNQDLQEKLDNEPQTSGKTLTPTNNLNVPFVVDTAKDVIFTANPKSFALAQSDAKELSEEELMLVQNVPWTFVSGNVQYANHLLKKYPGESHTIMTLGTQCYLLNAALALKLSEEEVASRLINRNVKCIYNASFEYYPEIIDDVFSKIIPTKEQLNGKTLVISRNLIEMVTMGKITGLLETYMKNKGINYVFDFTVSETTASESSERLEQLRNNNKVNISIVPDEFQKDDYENYNSIIKNILPPVHYRKIRQPDFQWPKQSGNERMRSILARMMSG